MVKVYQKNDFLPFKRVYSFLNQMASDFCKEKDQSVIEIISSFKKFTKEENINFPLNPNKIGVKNESYVLDFRQLKQTIENNILFYCQTEERRFIEEFLGYISANTELVLV